MQRTTGDLMFEVFVFTLLSIITAILIYPLVFVFFASFSDPIKVYESPFLFWPRGFNVVSYKKVFQDQYIWRGYANSIFYTTTGTLLGIILTIFGAYPLSRKDFYGRNVFALILVFTMFFSGGLIPTYLVIRSLKMINTPLAVIIPGSVSVYNMVIMRTYFQTQIPIELQEAAVIDGCNNLEILYKVVLPLSMPIIMVMVLFYGAGHWNAYFGALIYLTDQRLFPLQLVLRDLLIKSHMERLLTVVHDAHYAERVMQQEGMKFSIVVVSSVPMLILYPFLQRFFEKGILVGALKG